MLFQKIILEAGARVPGFIVPRKSLIKEILEALFQNISN